MTVQQYCVAELLLNKSLSMTEIHFATNLELNIVENIIKKLKSHNLVI